MRTTIASLLDLLMPNSARSIDEERRIEHNGTEESHPNV